jgi:uncharacterized protein (DUF3084 family)
MPLEEGSTATETAPEAESTETPQTEGTESAGSEGEGQPTTPTWQPNFKYKAGGEEKEIPDWLRPSVKNQEHEKAIRELHEKVYGFDKLKGTSTKLEQQLQQVLPEYSGMKNTINKVVQYRDAGDLDSFFEATGVKKEAVAQWMLKELQLQELSAEQRAVYENEQKLRKQNYTLQEQVASLSQSAQQGQQQAQSLSLQTALARPEVQSVADSYNARMATPDAFWNFVCQQADFMERMGGKPVTADQAVQEALRILGPAAPAPGQAQAGGAPQNPGPGAGSPNPPVIPNIGSRNSSPTKKLATSIDDLRRMAKEMS